MDIKGFARQSSSGRANNDRANKDQADISAESSFENTLAHDKPANDAVRDDIGPVSVIGETLRFNGALSADEDLIIDGLVEGSIDQGKCCLTIRPKGRVRANVNATKIFIEGNVEGDLKATVSVTVRKSGVVSGSIIAPVIALEEGSTFNGSIEMREPTKG